MRSIFRFCLLIAAAILPAMPQALAQSGVVSGPPQVRPGPSGPGTSGPGPSRPGPGGPGQPVPQDAGVTWIAVAGGFGGNGSSVGVGYSGHFGSRANAEDAAVNACQRNSRGVQCRQPLAVSTGCLFIAPGNRPGGVTWGRGATRALALEECRRGGYTCDRGRVIGGCVPGYTSSN